MQFRHRVIAALAVVGPVAAQAAALPTFPLYLQDEAVPLVTGYAASSNIYTVTVSLPVLCANTGPASGNTTSGSINAIYPNFIFGASAATPTVQQIPSGVTNVQYKTSQTPATYVIQADSSLGTPPLVCYVTDSNGVRKLTRDLFYDNFEHDYSIGAAPDVFDSSVIVTPVPNPPPHYYVYSVQITVPALPQSTDPQASFNFVLRDGYNTRVFSPTGSNTGWCPATSAAPTTCVATNPPTGPTAGDIDYPLTIDSSAQSQTLYFLVYRKYNVDGNSNDIVPNPGELLAIAALFSPPSLGEEPLGNNVASAVYNPPPTN